MVEFGTGVDGQNRSLVTVNKIPHSWPFARPKLRSGLRCIGNFLIEHPAQKLFHTMLLLVNLNVSAMMSWVVEERNDLGFKCHPVMLPDLGIFERIFIEKDVHGLTLFYRSFKVAHSFLPELTPILPYRLWWYMWSFDGWGRMASAWLKSIARSKIGSIGWYSCLWTD